VADSVVRTVSANLTRRLDKVVISWKEETLDFKFPDVIEESYRWRCEGLLNYFKLHEADQLRMQISYSDY
jgi:hypothetical protein